MNGMARKLSRFLRADIERGFIWAYYELVKGCQVTLDMRGENIIPVVALAHKPEVASLSPDLDYCWPTRGFFHGEPRKEENLMERANLLSIYTNIIRL